MSNTAPNTMSADELESFGDSGLAYVRPVWSDEVRSLFPQAPDLAPGLKLWALLTAEGQPILLTDDRSVAIANAHEHDLEPVSVH
ncbi:hypothetical protein SAMN05216548_107203 [Faunimonas pinastri]|uniref:DUF1150 domain-containing protein n=1 Tax=Faunimonas pinastri TaxID=1855383 RepID=A0A1H9ITK7_9HYPH|nr:DUF1150 domain-containing protein [Faunimonas pinastri]SEQ77904.1 hypothetical protein SAMN05216548_107203 [Faunimonas pinastri]